MSRIEQALRKARGLDPLTPTEEGIGESASGVSLLSEDAEGTPALEAPAPLQTRASSRLVGDPSIFTRIVAAPEDSRRRNPRDAGPEKLLTAADPGTAALEQFRCMAATLQQLQFERGLRILVVTSAASSEGKSLVASNLGVTLSRSYHRSVLLVDADLRRPGLHHFFGIRNGGGLSEAVSLEAQQNVPVYDVGSRLSLLPAGRSPRDPVSAFSSEGFGRLLTGAAAAFDWVILDAAPVGMLPDASLLASLADGVLFVVEAGRVPYRLIQRSIETVGPERVVGVVLNKVAENELVGGYGYQYYSEYFQPTKRR
jgi:capsular exopolysaccharide synthesis family protein